jgi:hypothetical protein
MSYISSKLLAAIAATLVAVLGFLAAYSGSVHVAVGPAETVFGAVSTLDGVDSPFVTIANKRAYIGSTPVLATSSAVCVLKNPFGQAASIRDIQVLFTTNNLGAIVFDVGTSSNGFATTTIIGQFTAAAAGTVTRYDWAPLSTSTAVTNYTNAGDMLVYERGASEALGSSRIILGSSDYLIVRAATTSAGGSTFTTYNAGQCGFDLSKI